MATFPRQLVPLWWRVPVAGADYASGAFAGLKPVVVVTGGSDGIGLALAKRFAADGHDLLLVARGEDRLAVAAEAIGSQHAARVATLALDVTRADAPAALDAALERAGRYAHILVNAAGIGLSGAFAAHEDGNLERLIALNVAALSRLMQHVLPGMRARGCGGVINLASLGGYVPGPWQAAYYASKAYVLSLSEGVAGEVARDGVRVCAVAPGPVETRFHERMRAETAFYRMLLPPLQPATVARWAFHGYKLGLRVIVPGSINMIMALALKLVPHRFVVPVTGWLLRPRRRESGDA